MKKSLIMQPQQRVSAPKNIREFRNGMITDTRSVQAAMNRRPTMQEVIRNFTGLDSVAGAFFFRELEYIKKKIFEVQHQPLSFRKLFPVTSEAGPGKRYITYRSYDRIAPAQMITNMSADLPRADVTAFEQSIQVRWIGASFGYDLGEIQASRVAGGEPLDARKAKAAFEGIETDLNYISFYGTDRTSPITSASCPALFNNALIPKYTAADGASGFTNWATKTPDEKLADVNNGFAAINNNSINVFEGNTLALPINAYNSIAATPRSSLSDTTILAYIVENSPFLNGLDSIVKVPELNGAATAIGGFTGNDSNDVMYFYNKNSDYLELEVPVEFQQEAPQQRNLEFLINCWANVAGLNIYQPLTMTFVAGI